MIQLQLQKLIDKKGISRRELSKLTNIRQQTINDYCNNTYKHLVKTHIEILCKFFNCNIQDLIILNDDNEN